MEFDQFGWDRISHIPFNKPSKSTESKYSNVSIEIPRLISDPLPKCFSQTLNLPVSRERDSQNDPKWYIPGLFILFNNNDLKFSAVTVISIS